MLALFLVFIGGSLIASWIEDIVAKPLREIAEALSAKEPQEDRDEEGDVSDRHFP